MKHLKWRLMNILKGEMMMRKNNPCENCGYYYYDECNGFEMCHYPEDEPHEGSPCEAADEADRTAREEAEWEEEKRQIEEEYWEEFNDEN